MYLPVYKSQFSAVSVLFFPIKKPQMWPGTHNYLVKTTLIILQLCAHRTKSGNGTYWSDKHTPWSYHQKQLQSTWAEVKPAVLPHYGDPPDWGLSTEHSSFYEFIYPNSSMRESLFSL